MYNCRSDILSSCLQRLFNEIIFYKPKNLNALCKSQGNLNRFQELVVSFKNFSIICDKE